MLRLQRVHRVLDTEARASCKPGGMLTTELQPQYNAGTSLEVTAERTGWRVWWPPSTRPPLWVVLIVSLAGTGITWKMGC